MTTPFIGLSFGLLAHRQRMGTAWWLYFFLHTRANFRDPSGRVVFTWQEAASALNTSKRNVHRWYRHLKAEGYVEPVGDDTGMEKTVCITKYKSVPLMARRDRSVNPHDRSVLPPMTELSCPTIIYKDTRYRTLKGFFEAAIAAIDGSHNPVAELRRFWEFVWGSQETPDFGRLGAAARRAGNGELTPGCRLLAMRALLAAVGRRVRGNPVDYVEKMGITAEGRPIQRGQASPDGDAWSHPDHGDWGQIIHATDGLS